MRKNKDVNWGTGCNKSRMAGSFVSSGTDGRRVGKHNLRRNNSGFTLVELIVVIVLIAVMAALTVGGILAWRDWADFNRENEYAETLFVAAQNQLNDYSANGRLADVQKLLMKGNDEEYDRRNDADYVYQVVDNWTYEGKSESAGKGTFVDAGYTGEEINSIWEGSNSEKKYQDRIVSIRADKGDYATYLNNGYNNEDQQYWVYELLSSYVYDTSILNDAAICIEFTPADGQVFSVFYSDKNNSYVYSKSEEMPSEGSGSVYDITHYEDEAKDNRSEANRRDRKVGYYDVATLYKSTSTASRRQPVIADVKMHNEETLYMTFEITKEPQAVNQMSYMVSLLDADKNNKPELVIEIDGTKIKGRDLSSDLLPGSENTEKYKVDCKVTRYDLACETGASTVLRTSEVKCEAVSSGVVMDSVPVIVWSEGTDSAGNYLTTGSTTVPLIHVVLDMADLNATQKEYKAYSEGIRSFYLNKRFGASGDKGLSQDKGIDDNSFASTQSFFRFGLTPDDVYVKVEGSATSRYKSPEPVNNVDLLGRNKENTGFAAGNVSTETKDGRQYSSYTWNITNSRHLYNMRYVEALDYDVQDIVLITDDTSAVLGYGSVAAADYVISRNDDNNGEIAWDKSIDKQLSDKADQPLRSISENSVYPACERLRVNDTLYGGGNVISGLKVKNEKAAEGSGYEAFLPTGFINRNYGTVKDLTLDRTEVSGGDFTGGFFGVNACEATNLTLTDSCTVEGRKYVGGIAGLVLPSGNHVDHSGNTELQKACNIYNMKTGESGELANAEVMYKLTNNASVTGSQAIGGIAGAVRNDYTFLKDMYAGSEEDGSLSDDELKALFPGLNMPEEGTDSLALLIKECESFGSLNCVANDATGIGRDAAAFTGGIAGYVYDRCKEDGEDDEELHIFIDNCNGAPVYDEEKLDGTNGIFRNVTAFKAEAIGDYAGGITGYNYGGQVSNCYSKAPDNGDSYVIGRNYVGGIAGLNLGYLGGDVESKYIKNGQITGRSSDAVPGVNLNTAAGDSYVGGIAGSNSDCMYSYTDNAGTGEASAIRTKEISSFDPEAIISERSDDNTLSVVPLRDINLNNSISGFVNRAEVYNSGRYGGGVTGYNTGYLFGNNSTYTDTGYSKTGNTAGRKSLFGTPADYTGSYIGAVAGYNNGIIGNTARTIASDGKSSTITDETAQSTAISAGCYILGGNFLGGIVGYNDSDSTIEDYNITSGEIHGNTGSCFVGGYAGFNSAPGLLMDLSATNDEDEEGSISYNGSHTIYSNISLIEGDYFVGGDVGGNILNKKENPAINNIGVAFRSDGFFRRLTGREFVGGYIGYNLIINNTGDELKAVDPDYENKNASMIVADYLAGNVGKTGMDIKANMDVADKLSDNLTGIKFVDTTDPASYMRLYIKGQKGNAVSAMSSITGELYVGGVMGYNDSNSILYIEDVENSTPIHVTGYVENADERKVNKLIGDLRVRDDDGTTDYTGSVPTDAFVYSYGGGIIGKVGARTTLRNCRNAQQGLIDTQGTYLGGLCEVNDGGKLISCSVSNLGYSTHDYVGGLCGLNKGVIEECSIDDKTITGRNVVGGLTAENLGVLRNNSINNTHIRALGLDVAGADGTEKHGVAGTYTGINGISGEIVLSLNRRSGSVYDVENIDVMSSGRYAGGIAGVNKGFISNNKDVFRLLYTGDYTGYSDDDMATWLSFTGTVRGESYVGGLVGWNDIDTEGTEESVALKYMLKGFDNYANVIADNGAAGGIVGQTTGHSNISFCANHGNVSAPLKGNSGGITAVNNGTISYCRDFASVSAVNGMSGGIVALNGSEGTLANIRVEAPSGVDQNITFESKTSCGAVAAQNKGRISGIYINKVNVTNESGYDRASIGAVVGENILPDGYTFSSDNEKYAYIYLDASEIFNCNVIIKSNYTNAGGIAGTNKGMIKGRSRSQKAAIVPVISMQGSDRATIGGVTGTNSGVIENISVDASITGGMGNASIGYGGIAGVNVTGLTSNTGIINCCTFDGYINTSGSSSNPASTGGIAGINRSGAVVKYCGLGVNTASKNRGGQTLISSGKTDRDYRDPDRTSYAYLGGIVGSNYGTVQDIDMAGNGDSDTSSNDLVSRDNVKVKGFNGTVGGVVGVNREGGIVRRGEEDYLKTSERLSVEMHGSETGSGAGGVIGTDYTGGAFEYIENNASVQALYDIDVRAGGVIGNCQPYGSKRLEMQNIINRGRVNGYYASGGLVGELMYSGYSIADCINYGNINSEAGDAGGMIGCSEMTNSSCDFTRCTNHGHVYVSQFAWDDDGYSLLQSAEGYTGLENSGEEGTVDPWDGSCPDYREYPNGNITYIFKLVDSWPGGYKVEAYMRNNSSETITYWAVRMKYQGVLPDTIVGASEVKVEKEGYYRLKNLSWDTYADPGSEVKLFEFNGNEDFKAFPDFISPVGSETVKSKDAYEISMGASSQGERFWRVVNITNKSSDTIECWTLRLALKAAYNGEITSIENREELLSYDGSRYVIKNGGNTYNGFISPGQTVSFNMYGTGDIPDLDDFYDIELTSYEDSVLSTEPSSEQTDVGGKHKHNGAGGLLGSYKEPASYKLAGAETINVYECVNTGIVERIWAPGAIPDEDHIAQNIGSFIGRGYSERESSSDTDYKANWVFQSCRNYNPIKDSTEGFIGTSVFMASETFVKCFDYSALVTSNEDYSPFITHRGGTISMSNCYYLNNEESGGSEGSGYTDTENGTYFTLIREKRTADTNIYYVDKQYKELKAPALYFTPPSETSDLKIPSLTGDLRINVANTADSPGMKTFNVYLWNGKKTKNTELVYNYKVSATFIKDKNNKTTVEKTVQATSELNTSKAVLEVPDWFGPVECILLHIEQTGYTGGDGHSNIYLRGFTWTPKNESKEHVCNYLSDLYDIEFNIDSIVSDSSDLTTTRGYVNESSSYYSDLLGARYYDNDRFIVKRSGSSTTINVGFGVYQGENSKGIDKLEFYFAADPDHPNRGYRYTYYAEIRNGTEGRQKFPAVGTGSTDTIYPYNTPERAEINVNSTFKDATLVNLYITGIEYTDNGYSWKKGTYVYFSGFGVIPIGDSNEYLMAPKSSSEGLDYASEQRSLLNAGYTEKAIKLSVDSSEAPERYKIYDPKASSHYFYMTENDPLNKAYYSDRTAYDYSRNNVQNGRIRVYEEIENEGDDNTDGKFIDFIKQDYEFDEEASGNNKLDKPSPLSFENDGAYLKFKWEKVENAYNYHIRYRITDVDGNKVLPESGEYYETTCGPETTDYSVYNAPDWEGKGYSIEFEIQSVNGGDEKYNSDYNTIIHNISKKVLPAPEVHLELTDDNNMAAVLDNRDDYAITDNEGNIQGYIDCDVKITYNGRGVREDRTEEYTIHVKDSRFSDQSRWVELDDEDDSTKAQILSWAEPTVESGDYYVASNQVVKSGHLADNEELWNGDSTDDDEEYVKYKGMTYIPYGYKKRLRGFKGDDVDNMKYLVQYKHFDDKNAWMRSDISVYDEDLEMWVAVTSSEAHIGAEEGHTSYNSYLENIPKEWFSQDNPTELLVRNYLARSENDIVLYGHDVASGIKLNGGSAEANKEILKKITNPYFLTVDWDTTTKEMQKAEVYNIKVIENESIWDTDNNCLKDGYVLVKNSPDENDPETGEPTYSIYYNSTLYLAKKHNTDEDKKNEETGEIAKDRYGNDYEYYKYDVVYKYYNTAVKETLIDPEDSEDPMTVSTNAVRAMDGHKEITLEGKTEPVGTNYNEAYQFSRTNDKYSSRIYQDTSPAPILSGGIRQGKDSNGNTTYTIRWDEFYRNEKVWNRSRLNPMDADAAAEMEGYEYYHPDHRDPAEVTKEGVWEDYYAANTWTAFANKTGYYDTESTSGRKAMMNAYYLTYAHNVSYTAEIIGINADGDEFVLDSLSITDEDKIAIEDAYTAITYVPKDSNGSRYKNEDGSYVEAPLYKKWAYQATFTRDADWIYDSYKIRITNNGSRYSMLEGLTDPDGVLMGVDATRDGNIGKLYYDSPFDDVETDEDYENLCSYRLPKYREFDLIPRVPFDAIYDTQAEYKTEGEFGNEKSLSYTVKWSWSGFDSDKQTKDLGGFLITAKKNGDETKDGVKDHYYYVEEIPNTEAVNASIDLDTVTLSSNGIVTKLDTVSANYIPEGNTRSVDIDLSDFYDGDRVDLSVTAIPRTGARDYCDSEEGTPFELIVDSARHAPDPDKLNVVDNSGSIPEYEDAQFSVSGNFISEGSIFMVSEDDEYKAVSYDTWKNGLWISYKTDGTTDPADYSNDGTVVMNAAIAVYEDAPDENELPPAGDLTEEEEAAINTNRRRAIPDSSSSWNLGATATLYTKDEPLVMGQVADQGIIQVVLGDESDEFGTRYAGKWLKIALKVTAETGIDSRWSDQDGAEVSINYRWIHLPYIIKPDENEGDEGAVTFSSLGLSSGAGDLLTEGSDLNNDDRGSDGDGGLLEENDNEQVIKDNSLTQSSAITFIPTPTPTPTPTASPQDAGMPSSGSDDSTDGRDGGDEDKSKGESGGTDGGTGASGSENGTGTSGSAAAGADSSNEAGSQE